MISTTSVSNTEATGTGNLQFSGLVVPVVANWERDAAPSQYQIRRAFLSNTSFPLRDTIVPANTPALYVLTIQYFPFTSFSLLRWRLTSFFLNPYFLPSPRMAAGFIHGQPHFGLHTRATTFYVDPCPAFETMPCVRPSATFTTRSAIVTYNPWSLHLLSSFSLRLIVASGWGKDCIPTCDLAFVFIF